ncbi:GPN-loop GTPase 3 [Binucleata daphniae]
MKNAIFVFGPSGCGKSTFTNSLYEHGQLTNRSFTRVNLDPGQQTNYELDITHYITTDLVMSETDLGPNGSLVYSLREFYDNIEDLELDEYDYLIIDIPGQIELYVHSDVMYNIVLYFQRFYNCVSVFLMDCQFCCDVSKFLGACLSATIGITRLGLPNVNVMTKIDLLENNVFTFDDTKETEQELDINEEILGNNKLKYDTDTLGMQNFEFKQKDNVKKYRVDVEEYDEMYLMPNENLRRCVERLEGKNKIFCGKVLDLLLENNMINFIKLNYEKRETIEEILYEIDTAVQYFDDCEPKESYK